MSATRPQQPSMVHPEEVTSAINAAFTTFLAVEPTPASVLRHPTSNVQPTSFNRLLVSEAARRGSESATYTHLLEGKAHPGRSNISTKSAVQTHHRRPPPRHLKTPRPFHGIKLFSTPTLPAIVDPPLRQHRCYPRVKQPYAQRSSIVDLLFD